MTRSITELESEGETAAGAAGADEVCARCGGDCQKPRIALVKEARVPGFKRASREERARIPRTGEMTSPRGRRGAHGGNRREAFVPPPGRGRLKNPASP